MIDGRKKIWLKPKSADQAGYRNSELTSPRRVGRTATGIPKSQRYISPPPIKSKRTIADLSVCNGFRGNISSKNKRVYENIAQKLEQSPKGNGIVQDNKIGKMRTVGGMSRLLVRVERVWSCSLLAVQQFRCRQLICQVKDDQAGNVLEGDQG